MGPGPLPSVSVVADQNNARLVSNRANLKFGNDAGKSNRFKWAVNNDLPVRIISARILSGAYQHGPNAAPNQDTSTLFAVNAVPRINAQNCQTGGIRNHAKNGRMENRKNKSAALYIATNKSSTASR